MMRNENRPNWNGFKTRPATCEDVDKVVDLINAAALADTGMAATNREEKLIEWGLPQFSMETDTLLVLAPDGQAAGFVELWDSKPHVRHHLWGRVHPDCRDQGIGNYLMEWAEVRARQSLHKAPPRGARLCAHRHRSPHQCGSRALQRAWIHSVSVLFPNARGNGAGRAAARPSLASRRRRPPLYPRAG